MIPSAGKPKTVKPQALPTTKLFMVGGASGVGKTHLLGTLGKGKKALIIDTEGGGVTFNSPAYQQDPNATEPDNLDILDLSRVDNLKELVFEVENALDYVIRSKNADGYDLVAIDSLTEFQNKFISKHTAPDPRQSYGELNKTGYGIVERAKQMPTNMVVTTLLTYKDDEALGREIVRPALSPGLWALAGQFHAVGFYELRNQGPSKQVRTLDFTHRTRMPGKSRGIFLEGSFTDPSMATLLFGSSDEQASEAPARPKFVRNQRAVSAGGK